MAGRYAALAAVILGLASPAAAQAPERRCGWIHNPTPGNHWLVDRDGTWIISAQAGYQARGMDRMPDMTVRDWVVTNGVSYGYGCACLTMVVDPKAKEVRRIDAVQQLVLARCRADPALPRPD